MNIIFNENCLDTMKRPELKGGVDLVITSPSTGFPFLKMERRKKS